MTHAVRFNEENGNDRKAYAKHGTVTPAVVTDTATISLLQILDRLTQHTKVPRVVVNLCQSASSVAAPAD